MISLGAQPLVRPRATTMRAAALDRYGPPNVLAMHEVRTPTFDMDQVLIRVEAAGVNPIDWRIRRGSRRWLLPGRFPLVLGYDASGVVAEVGSRVTRVKPGDEVFSFLDSRFGGGYAEFAVASEDVAILKPKGLSHIEAAAVPLAASTALQALRDHGRVGQGASVLVNGASGGVGTFAVQIAKALGAEVTGVSSGASAPLVESLGADRVIDYAREDFTQDSRRYDLVFDAVGKSSYWLCRRILKPRGRYVSTLPTPANYLAKGVSMLMGGQQAGVVFVRPRGNDLRALKGMIEQGLLRVVIDHVFPLEQAAEAHGRSEQGHARGKIVLQTHDDRV